MERNFERINRRQWTLVRVSASNGGSPEVGFSCQGKLKDGARGAFLSHLKAIDLSQSLAEHTMIAEDDILFGENSLTSVEAVIRTLGDNAWDLIFTDIVVPSMNTMIQLYRVRQQLTSPNELKIFDLKTIQFAGATAYVVNERFKPKLLSMLQACSPFDVP